MGLWNSIKKAARSVGKFVRKNWKTIVGVAAAVAIPFAAPAIGGLLAGSAFLSSVAPGVASFLGGSLGSGLIGAGLGAGTAALTGQNPLLGAALGGVGGFAGSALGAGGMFGGSGLSGVPTGAGAVVPATGGIIDIGSATVNAATGMAAGASGSAIGALATKLAINPQSLGALAQLATVMFNKDMTELTPEEEAQLQEVAAQAATNRALFETQVMEARKLIQAGTPNPEQAYANARMQTEAQLGENRRSMPVGLQEADERKGAIESTKAGLQNVALDYAQAAQTRRAGIQSMPDGAPTGYAQLAMPTYNSLYERQNDYNEQISRGVGALFGSLA